MRYNKNQNGLTIKIAAYKIIKFKKVLKEPIFFRI